MIESDLINVSSFGKRRVNFNAERGQVCFYCHDCETFVAVRKMDPSEAKKAKHHSRQHAYACEKCKKFNVSFGTEESLREVYEIKPNQKPPVPSVVNLPAPREDRPNHPVLVQPAPKADAA